MNYDRTSTSYGAGVFALCSAPTQSTRESEQQMLRKMASKVAWVGRTASMVLGLALVMALVLGVASVALAGTGVGDTFNLGQQNTANKISSLVGSASSAMLKIDNNGAGPALALQVEPGEQPMTVNSDRRVARLNADKLDGKDSTDLLPGGTLPRASTIRGAYVIRFDPAAAGRQASESISFGYTLASEPTSLFVPSGSTPPAGCPGTASNPQADPGFLCVYENSNVGTTNTVICNPVSNTCGVPASRFGAYLRTDSTGTAASTRTVGTWAVTGS